MKTESAATTISTISGRGNLARGARNGRAFSARYEPSEAASGECGACGSRTIRSRTTGILHDDCYTCRYLKMIYGDSIKVRRLQ